MAKVTSKLQVTVPKTIADRFGIRPGDDIDWRIEGSSIRVVRRDEAQPLSAAERLRLFDEATARQDARNRAWRRQHRAGSTADRGWTRQDAYQRGRTR